MSTKLAVFIKMYLPFKKDLIAMGVDETLFPNLTDVHPVDIISNIITGFYGCTTDEDYKRTLKLLCGLKGISVPEPLFEKVFPLILKMVKFVQEL
jgi:hypothetical protein